MVQNQGYSFHPVLGQTWCNSPCQRLESSLMWAGANWSLQSVCEEIKIVVTQEIPGGSVTQGINNGDKRPLSIYSRSHLVAYHSHLVFPLPRWKWPNETPGTSKLSPIWIFQILGVVTGRWCCLRYVVQYPSAHLGAEALGDERCRENCSWGRRAACNHAARNSAWECQ